MKTLMVSQVEIIPGEKVMHWQAALSGECPYAIWRRKLWHIDRGYLGDVERYRIAPGGVSIDYRPRETARDRGRDELGMEPRG